MIIAIKGMETSGKISWGREMLVKSNLTTCNHHTPSRIVFLPHYHFCDLHAVLLLLNYTLHFLMRVLCSELFLIWGGYIRLAFI